MPKKKVANERRPTQLNKTSDPKKKAATGVEHGKNELVLDK
jgi:hypothetical protein